MGRCTEYCTVLLWTVQYHGYHVPWQAVLFLACKSTEYSIVSNVSLHDVIDSNGTVPMEFENGNYSYRLRLQIRYHGISSLVHDTAV